jgi:putative ABC transport system permease protein
MVILFKKAARSVWRDKRAYIACVALIAMGVFMFTALGGAARALDEGARNYYKTNRLADVFAKTQSIDAASADALKNIEGVADVLPRITYDARTLVDGSSKIIYLRLISFDADFDGTPLNAPLYDESLNKSAINDENIIVGQAFLDAHGIKKGDSLTMIIEGKETTFTVASGVISPEYVYAIRDFQELFPDTAAFNVAYVGLDRLGSLLGRTGYNDVSFKLESGYTFDDVKDDITEELEPFGLTELIEREDQISVKMLNSEITQISSMSVTVSVIFAAMAAVVLILMLKRVIEREREQIGTLKAFGYTNAEVVTHYLYYGIVTGVVGGALGVIFGNAMTKPMIDLYSEYFTLPDVATTTPVDLALIGFLVSVAFGGIGAFLGAKSVIRLAPAEAMRPPSPPPVKNDVIRTFPFLKKLLSSHGNMALRNITRARGRSVFTIGGIMFSVGMLACMSSMNDMVDAMMYDKFTKIQVYDGRLILETPSDIDGALREAASIDGITAAEPTFDVPAQIRSANVTESAIITGLPRGAKLYKIYDDNTDAVKEPSENGITLASYVAERLHVSKGGYVYVKTPYNEDEVKLVVEDIVSQNMSTASFMELNALNDVVLGLSSRTNAVTLGADDLNPIKDYAIDAKNISIVEDANSVIDNYNNMMGSVRSLMWFMFIAAAGIAYAIIYNSANISLSEKKREYATLRVIGLSPREVAGIMRFEYWTLFVAGCLAGIPFTKFLKTMLFAVVQVQFESLKMPTETSLNAFATAFAGCAAALILANFLAEKAIKKFDMAVVLKERE